MSSNDFFEHKKLNEAFALHSDFYNQKLWLDIEQKQVFAKSWQLAAHVCELQKTGDHVVCEIAGKSILIVRTSTGKLNAFHNVCRHRAGPIATCNGKAAKALKCAYHGWSYSLDGQLQSAPEMKDACNFNTKDIFLPQVKINEWQGLVFVAMSNEAPAFDSIFNDIATRIKPIDISDMTFSKRDTYTVACNWKVYVDNYLEGYHLPHVHPGLSKVLDYQIYDTELNVWSSLQHSPLRNNDGIYGDGHAYYYFIYPNIMLNITPGRLQTNRILPLGHDKCIVEFDYYYINDPDVHARAQNEQSFSDEIQREDILICEHVQKGLESGSYSAGRLSPKRESGVWHFQNLLRSAYAEVN